MMREKEENEIEALYRIDKFMKSMSDMNKLLEVIISEARNVTDAESCSLVLYDDDQNDMYFKVAMGEEGEGEVEHKLKRIRMRRDEGIVGWVAVNMQPLNVTDVYNDPRFYKEVDKLTGFITRSILAVPMSWRGKSIGAIEAVNKCNEEGFSEHDEKVLTVLASQAALVIENARLYEENLRQTRLSALGQGIAGAAHFVKNILTGINGGADILEYGIKERDIDRIVEGWNIVKKSNEPMKNLVLDMLNYSTNGKPEYELTDVNEVCKTVVELMREKAKKKDVEILFNPSFDLCQMFLDAKGIYRCILNLVSNAIDACDKPHGAVEITTRIVEANRWFEIIISDNGCGISEENLKKLFTPFFSTKSSEGTGLGLAITYKIISEHGGRMNVESELCMGTKFTIELPIN